MTVQCRYKWTNYGCTLKRHKLCMWHLSQMQNICVLFYLYRSFKKLCMPSHFSCIPLLMTLRTVACQAPLSMGFSRQEYWSGLPCPSPGDLSDPGTKFMSLIYLYCQASSLPLVPPGKPLLFPSLLLKYLIRLEYIFTWEIRSMFLKIKICLVRNLADNTLCSSE